MNPGFSEMAGSEYPARAKTIGRRKEVARLLWVVLAVLLVSGFASAQHQMSPPERPPIPLSDSDQARTAHAVPIQPAASAKLAGTTVIKTEEANAVTHISSGSPVTDALILEAAVKYGVDPCLVISVMVTESSFNSRAVSPKGASGLMQLMPDTAARFGVINIFDPRENVHGGVRYLRWLLNHFSGDLRLAIAAYNAGEGAVEFYGNQIPPYQETQNYVRKVYARYSAAHAFGKEAGQAVADNNAERPAAPSPAHNQIIRLSAQEGGLVLKSPGNQ